jgi:hypothetical protein
VDAGLGLKSCLGVAKCLVGCLIFFVVGVVVGAGGSTLGCMSNMMRGRVYSCGCCRSRPVAVGSERAVEGRVVAREVAEEWECLDEEGMD